MYNLLHKCFKKKFKVHDLQEVLRGPREAIHLRHHEPVPVMTDRCPGRRDDASAFVVKASAYKGTRSGMTSPWRSDR